MSSMLLDLSSNAIRAVLLGLDCLSRSVALCTRLPHHGVAAPYDPSPSSRMCHAALFVLDRLGRYAQLSSRRLPKVRFPAGQVSQMLAAQVLRQSSSDAAVRVLQSESARVGSKCGCIFGLVNCSGPGFRNV